MPRLRPGSAIAVGDEASRSTSVNRENRLVALVHLVCFVHLVSLVQLNKPNRPNKQDKPDEPPVLGLGLAGRLCLFPFELGPAVIEPLRGGAGCVQRCRSFL